MWCKQAAWWCIALQLLWNPTIAPEDPIVIAVTAGRALWPALFSGLKSTMHSLIWEVSSVPSRAIAATALPVCSASRGQIGAMCLYAMSLAVAIPLQSCFLQAYVNPPSPFLDPPLKSAFICPCYQSIKWMGTMQQAATCTFSSCSWVLQGVVPLLWECLQLCVYIAICAAEWCAGWVCSVYI